MFCDLHRNVILIDYDESYCKDCDEVVWNEDLFRNHEFRQCNLSTFSAMKDSYQNEISGWGQGGRDNEITDKERAIAAMQIAAYYDASVWDAYCLM